MAWRTGAFWGMGIAGSVKLGCRAELLAIEDPAERKRIYDEMVARTSEREATLNTASPFGADDTIDPADSRSRAASLLRSARPRLPRERKKRPAIDVW